MVDDALLRLLYGIMENRQTNKSKTIGKRYIYCIQSGVIGLALDTSKSSSVKGFIWLTNRSTQCHQFSFLDFLIACDVSIGLPFRSTYTSPLWSLINIALEVP